MAHIIRPKVQRIDKAERMRRLEIVLERARNSYVTVGIKEASATYPGGKVTVGQVAAWMEFGTHHGHGTPRVGMPMVPSRSFLRAPIEKGQKEIAAARDKAVMAVVMGEIGIGPALGRIGATIQLMMQNAITQGLPPPLAETTIERKRKLGQPDTPLIATRFLFDHIGFAVVLNH